MVFLLSPLTHVMCTERNTFDPLCDKQQFVPGHMTLKLALCLFYSRRKKTVCTCLNQVGSAYTFYLKHVPVTRSRINPSFLHILACGECRKKLLPLLVILLYWNASITLPKPNGLITGWDLLTLYWKKSQPDTTVQPPSLSLSASMSSEQSFTKQHLKYEFILGATRTSFTIQIRVGTEYDEKCPNANSCLLKHNRAIHSLGHVLMLHQVLNTNIEKPLLFQPIDPTLIVVQWLSLLRYLFCISAVICPQLPVLGPNCKLRQT